MYRNYTKTLRVPKGYVSKLLLIMKLTAFLLLISLMQVSAAIFGQKVTFKADNVTINGIFKEITKQTGYSVMVDRTNFSIDRKISANFSGASLEEVMGLVLKGTGFSFEITDGNIMVEKREKSLLDRVVEAFRAIDVRGKVVGESGGPLAGATVRIKGTERIAQTGADGSFSFAGVAEDAVLVVSYVGYIQAELKAKASMTITLKFALAELQEVTVNKGYYTTTERLNTGSVAKVTAKEIERQPVINPLLAIQGRMPGVFVTQDSGTPGTSIQVQIRGRNSIRNDFFDNGNLPLYVVDGIPFPDRAADGVNALSNATNGGNPLNFINTNDIESIEVLKDGDATSIYGTRGANGVVLITTKSGKFGANQTEFNYYTGSGTVGRRLAMLNREQYIAMRKEAKANDNAPIRPSDNDINGNWDQNTTTDWQEYILGNSSSFNSLSGAYSAGGENSRINIAGRFHRETTLWDSKMGSTMVTLKSAYNFKDKAGKFDGILSLQYNYSNNRINSFDPTPSVRYAPNAPAVFNPDGTYNWSGWDGDNPFAQQEQKASNELNSVLLNAQLKYKLADFLSLRLNGGWNSNISENGSINPISGMNPAYSPTGISTFGNTKIQSWIMEPSLNFERRFSYAKLGIVAAATLQHETLDAREIMGYGYIDDNLLDNLAFAAGYYPMGVNHYKYRYAGLRMAANYVLKDRYVLNVTASRDGSTRFSKSNRFGNFGSVAAAWIFASEPFFQKAIPFFSSGKLRSSYGISGSDKIPPYGYLSSYAAEYARYNGGLSLYPSQIGNEGYTWEQSRKFELALELGMFQNRLKLTAAYYDNTSSNQLVGYTLAPTTGFSSIRANLDATVANYGYEFELQSVNFRSDKFQWNTSFNFSLPKNKLLKFDNLTGSSYARELTVGESLFSRRRYTSTGVDPQTGLYTFQDRNGDGLLRLVDDASPSFTGMLFQGGLANSFSYKNFTLDFNFMFVKQKSGNYATGMSSAPGRLQVNFPIEVLDRWQKPGDISDVARFGTSTAVHNNFNDFKQSDGIIVDASYIKLKNLSLAYNLKGGLLNKMKVGNARVYLQGQNLLTITNYTGWDPETANFFSLPTLRIITGGVQLTF